MTFKQAQQKQFIEYIVIYPIVLLGKIYALFNPLKKRYSHFLFFPSADIGGSIKVNAEIAECIKHKQPLIIFSKIPKNNKFIDLFNIDGVDILDLSKKIDNKYYHFINIFYRGVLSTWINKNPKPIVLGGECIYFYKIIPHVKKETKRIEVCHLTTWFNYTLGFINKIDVRIFSTPKVKRDMELLYKKNNLPQSYFDKLHFVDNKIEIPILNKPNNNTLQLLYVGRGAPQKRVHLIVKIVEQIYLKKINAHFTFVGDVENYFTETNKQYCTLLGEVKDKKQLETIYNNSDALILTSAYEGLPLVVMDMMARGRTVISTAVDGIPDYIKHLETGLLIENKSETEIVEDAIKMIELLVNNPSIKHKIECNAYEFAKSHFCNEIFDTFYKTVLDAI